MGKKFVVICVATQVFFFKLVLLISLLLSVVSCVLICSNFFFTFFSVVSKVVVLDSLEKLAGLAVAKALRGEEGLERLECSEIQKEIVGGLLDRQEKMTDWEIEMHREPDCGTEEEEEDINEEEEVSVGVTSGGEKSIGTLENLDPESEERNMAASKESTVLSSSEEEDDEKSDDMKTYDEDSIDKDSTGKGSQRRKTENEERKMAPSINKELIPVM